MPSFRLPARRLNMPPAFRVQANELLLCISEIAARAAWLVHAEDRSIKNAAKLLDTSRFAVARLLQQVSHHAQQWRWMMEKMSDSSICTECAEAFSFPVWHCPVCGHHSHLEDKECGNCHYLLNPTEKRNAKT